MPSGFLWEKENDRDSLAGKSVCISIILKYGGMASDGCIGFSTGSRNMFMKNRQWTFVFQRHKVKFLDRPIEKDCAPRN
jgi:hypothetical protein